MPGRWRDGGGTVAGRWRDGARAGASALEGAVEAGGHRGGKVRAMDNAMSEYLIRDRQILRIRIIRRQNPVLFWLAKSKIRQIQVVSMIPQIPTN